MTIGEKIKQMTNEELADFLTNVDFCTTVCANSCIGDCKNQIFEWLKQEVSEWVLSLKG